MSIIHLGKINVQDRENKTRSSEVTYDGRTIGLFTMVGDDPGRFDADSNAKKKDIQAATKMAMNAGAPSLQSHINEMFLATEAKETSLRRMRNRLRKQTLFATPDEKVRVIASPYCERIRSRIKKEYPEAVILNTLSEDEAFRHYFVGTS